MVLSGVRVLLVEADAVGVADWSGALCLVGASCDHRARPGKGLEVLLLSAADSNPHQVVVLGPSVPTAMRDAFRHTLVGNLTECRIVEIVQAEPQLTLTPSGALLGLDNTDAASGESVVCAVSAALKLSDPTGSPAPSDDGPQPLPPAAPAQQAPERLHILLAEDNIVNQEVAEAALRGAGWHVTAVPNGLQAVSLVASGNFHAIVMDIQMPKMDGLSATRAIRLMDEPTCRIPIVAMTANALPAHRAAVREAGMNGFVSKPISASRLVHAIQTVVHGTESAQPQPPSDATTKPESVSLTALDNIIELLVLKDLKETFGPALSRVQGTLAADAPARLQRMLDAARTDDFATLEREAHSLKSSSGTFGLKRVSQLCRSIEYACSDRRFVEAKDGLRSLETILHNDLDVLASHM